MDTKWNMDTPPTSFAITMNAHVALDPFETDFVRWAASDPTAELAALVAAQTVERQQLLAEYRQKIEDLPTGPQGRLSDISNECLDVALPAISARHIAEQKALKARHRVMEVMREMKEMVI